MTRFLDKNSIRKWAKEFRKTLDMRTISNKLIDKLKNTEEYKKAKNIMIFYPLKNEVDLRNLLNDNDKNFYLPRIKDKELLCCPYNKEDSLQESCFKTLEPTTKPCAKEILDLVIIPAISCDTNNCRLGYGGGFYDRFLENITATKIVCIPKELVIETIYPESHDAKIDLIITE